MGARDASAGAGERRGRLLLGGRLVPGRVVFAAGRIERVEPEARADAAAPIVAPGLVDLHVHGFGGLDPLGDLAGMARALARAGTTAFQPTLLPDAPDRLGAQAAAVHAASRRLDASGEPVARALGLHLEGPFVNPARAGALPRDGLAEPSPAALRAILGPESGDGRGVRSMTIAPELPGARALVAELARCGVRPSLGHSAATADEAEAAARAGATGVTHLFNAMSGFHHREVGLAGFALTDGTPFVELIGDLVHVGPRAVALALAARGPGALCLVSDALPGAGTGCEVFEWCGRRHAVRGGAAWWSAPDAPGAEEALAGSALGQLEMVRRLTAAGVLGVEEALETASASPARALGLEGELGTLTPGARADLLVLSGEDLALREVLVGGIPVPPGAPGSQKSASAGNPAADRS